MSDRLAVLPQYLLPKQTLTTLAGRTCRRPAGASPRRRSLVCRPLRRQYGRSGQAGHRRLPDLQRIFARPLGAGSTSFAEAAYLPGRRGDQPSSGHRAGPDFQARATAIPPPPWSVATPPWPKFPTAALSHPVTSVPRLPPHPYALRRPPAAHDPRSGALFSVNPTTARGVPGLFARNERVCVFENDAGPSCSVLVGATIVGSMATVWHGWSIHRGRVKLRQWTHPPGQVDRGGEKKWAVFFWDRR